MKILILAAIRCSVIFLLATFAQANSATWKFHPSDGNWNVAGHWIGGTVPNGEHDTATFDESDVRRVQISEDTTVLGITFTPDATNPFTITASPGFTLTLVDGGITNSSVTLHNFVAAANGEIVFTLHATAGSSTQFTNRGTIGDHFSGRIRFKDDSTAGSGMFINNGGEGEEGNGGGIDFSNRSSGGAEGATRATFTNNGGQGREAFGAFILFSDNSTAGGGVFTNNAGNAHNTIGAFIYFLDTSNAGNAMFTNKGGVRRDLRAGIINFGFTANGGRAHSSAGSGTFTNEAGEAADADGGSTFFYGPSDAGNATTGNGSTFINKGAPVARAEAGSTHFFESSRADMGPCNFMNEGGTAAGAAGGSTEFSGTETPFQQPIAGGTFTNKASTVPNALPGHTDFGINSYAGHGSFTNNGATVAFAGGGYTRFASNSSAGNGTITNEGTTVANFSGTIAGYTVFIEGATAGNGRFNNLGGDGIHAGGGFTDFLHNSKAGSATLIANGGTNGGYGGAIGFGNDSTGDSSQVELSGNGTLAITTHNPPGVTIGSLTSRGAGGNVILGGNNLTVGSNNMDTTFSGVIQDDVFPFTGGSLTKVGTGTLTLSGHNTYTGGTTIADGKLLVTNVSGSGTGSGDVMVIPRLGGTTLGGTGMIAGAVSVGMGLAAGAAVLSPGINERSLGMLTIQSSLTFENNGTYHVELDNRIAMADGVVANGVTITNGAKFSLDDFGNRTLPLGTRFYVIKTMPPTPINGIFSGLPNGSILTTGHNSFRVNYGNDLTLTVVQHPPP